MPLSSPRATPQRIRPYREGPGECCRGCAKSRSSLCRNFPRARFPSCCRRRPPMPQTERLSKIAELFSSHPPSLETGLPLADQLVFGFFRGPLVCPSHFGAEQRQGIFGVEGELANGLLPGTAQGNVHAPVLCQCDGLQITQDFVSLLLAQVGMLFNQLLYLLGG